MFRSLTRVVRTPASTGTITPSLRFISGGSNKTTKVAKRNKAKRILKRRKGDIQTFHPKMTLEKWTDKPNTSFYQSVFEKEEIKESEISKCIVYNNTPITSSASQ